MNKEDRDAQLELLQLRVDGVNSTMERMADFMNGLSMQLVAHQAALVSFAALADAVGGRVLQKWQRSYREICAAHLASAAMSEEGLQTSAELRRALESLEGLLFSGEQKSEE